MLEDALWKMLHRPKSYLFKRPFIGCAWPSRPLVPWSSPWGVGIALVAFARALLARKAADFNAIRLVLTLEFQLGADILSTAVAPPWNEIGKLGAIAVIRTTLNFFLSREMQEERRTAEGERSVQAQAGSDRQFLERRVSMSADNDESSRHRAGRIRTPWDRKSSSSI